MGKTGYESNRVEGDYPGNLHNIIHLPDSIDCGEGNLEDATVMISYPNDYNLLMKIYNELSNYSMMNHSFIYIAIERLLEDKSYYFEN